MPAAEDAGAAALLLRLPTFMFAVWLMYWSLPLGAACMYIRVWDWQRPRNDPFYW